MKLFSNLKMIIHNPNKVVSIRDIKACKQNYALVILNRPILADKQLVSELWTNSSLNITVDGGTNRWLTWLVEHQLQDKLPHPTLITGDLDSCRSESVKFFNRTKIVRTVDQDETDFTKCLRILEPFLNDLNVQHVVALCETSGRIDHIIANVNTLYKNIQKSRQIFILSSTSLSWMLPNGQHRIYIPENVRSMWCSLVPIGHPVKVTTKGLKWNLTGQTIKFGGIVSTSNKYDEMAEYVDVWNDNPLLWSMGLKDED